MEEKTIFSLDELKTRWQCSSSTIRNMAVHGQLKQLHGLPRTMYRAKEVYALEGMDKADWDPMSPFERRKKDSQIAVLEKENRKLRTKLFEIASITNDAVSKEINDMKEP